MRTFLKHIIVVLGLTVVSVLPVAGKDINKLTPENIARALADMNIAQGKAKYVKSAETTDKMWKAHLFRVQQNRIQLPIVVYTNEKAREIVIGVLVKDRKLVVPKLSAEDLQPQIVAVDVSRLSTQDRIVYNPSGSKTIYMFTDPDCPYCQQLEEKLIAYNGEYKIIVKHFPLEPIHPEAKTKAINRQKEWLMKTKNIDEQNAYTLAVKIVEQDMEEGVNIGVDATPLLLDVKGNILQGISDLK